MSCEGTPSLNGANLPGHLSFAFPRFSMSTHVFASHMTATKATSSTSPSG